MFYRDYLKFANTKQEVNILLKQPFSLYKVSWKYTREI